MTYTPEKIFVPGKPIEIVFNIDSLSPVSRNSIIFDLNPKKKEIIVSQTTPNTGKFYSYETLHITTLKNNELNQRTRFGIKGSITGFIDNYKLNNQTTEPALKITYSGKVSEANIRSAFRIKPNNVYSVMAKIILKNKDYISGKNFRIYDISLTGMGILIPNSLDRRKNPLIELELNDLGKIGIVMKSPGSEKDLPEIKKIFNRIKTVRINRKFNERYILIGFKFGHWERSHEEILGKFIHQLQLFEIRHHQNY